LKIPVCDKEKICYPIWVSSSAAPLPEVTIHFARTGKPTRVFKDGLVDDNGIRLRTFSSLGGDIRSLLSGEFQAAGLLQPGQQIAGVEKFLFYTEHFSIMQFLDRSSQVLGVYTDIATPLRRVEQEYRLVDLCLDIWQAPESRISVLDEDEFEQACKKGLIEPRLARTARLTLERLLAEAQAGIFPGSYTR